MSSVNDTTGSATITFSVAADTNYKAPSNKTVAITASFKPTASTTATSGVTYTDGLSGLDAETVSLFGEAISNNSAITNTTSTVYIDFGSVHRKIDIGDQVTLALNGTNYTFDVIGFNHDTLTTAAAYGANTATGKAGMTLQMHDLFATTYPMNSSNTNSGGWKSSAMRTSTMATMKGYLPDDWEAIIKPVNKASGTGGGSSSGTETVSDSCFLLAKSLVAQLIPCLVRALSMLTTKPATLRLRTRVAPRTTGGSVLLVLATAMPSVVSAAAAPPTVASPTPVMASRSASACKSCAQSYDCTQNSHVKQGLSTLPGKGRWTPGLSIYTN